MRLVGFVFDFVDHKVLFVNLYSYWKYIQLDDSGGVCNSQGLAKDAHVYGLLLQVSWTCRWKYLDC